MRSPVKPTSVVVALALCVADIAACSSNTGDPASKPDASAGGTGAAGGSSGMGGAAASAEASSDADSDAVGSDAGVDGCPGSKPADGDPCGWSTNLCDYAEQRCACLAPSPFAPEQIPEWRCEACPAARPSRGDPCSYVFPGHPCVYSGADCSCSWDLSSPGWVCVATAPDAGPTDPIPTRPLEWLWVPFPEAKCRDGSMAGIAVNAGPGSDKLMIFLQQGGGCWNAATCGYTRASIDQQAFDYYQGIFDRTNAANPVKDWNFVFVPYCTGDLHAGNNPGFDPGGGVGPQQFVGYTNLEKFLARIVPTFPNVTKVLHTGSSAGGFGSMLTVELVGKKFPSTVDLIYLDDSGPGMANPFAAACMLHKNWTTWGFDKTFLVDCGADCPNPDNFLLEYPQHLAKAYPTRRGGIIEAAADNIIAGCFGFGVKNCSGDQTAWPTALDAATFEAGLLDFRTQMASIVPDGGTPNFGTFYLPGTDRMHLVNGVFYADSVGGTTLVDWVMGIVNGGAPTTVGP